ncbi:MAG: type I restriction endonuclease subunit R [Labilithrix sp.]
MYDGAVSPGTLEAEVEEAALELFTDLGWKVARVMDETFGEKGTLGRETKGDVVLFGRLRPALEKLNPKLPREAIDQAIDVLTRDRAAMGSIVAANRDVHALLKQGVKVKVPAPDGEEGMQDVTVRVIDWEKPEANDFLVAQQLWVQGEIYQRRADLVGFVNGLPLVFIELKGLHKNVENAYRDNYTDYQTAIPNIFWFNGVVVLSNGFESRIGSVTGAWEHFKEWKRIEREDEPATVSLETMLRGVCDKARLLDLVENFTLFSEQKSAVAKIVGQNHQFLGVNNAIAAVRKYQLASTPPGVGKDVLAARRRLGVFWHTQGSGKSFSMVFFSQKILRRLPGNWTFVIITDREDLDDQIYKTFAACGAVKDKNVQAKSAENLKQLLTEDHRYVFTLIQKFRTDVKGATYPKLSDRSDIIVIADEAHRSQYDTFALNMRQALPNAAFIGFTGTPLMAGEEKTREVFGDYVSVYNFRQAIEDNATVPLYYEARIPELQLTNEDLGDDLAALIEEADLDEEQQKKVEREFSRQYHLITREDRLDTIAADIVTHFLGLNTETERPGGTKAMVVAIDKLTAVRMHDKVKAAWAKKKKELEEALARTAYEEKAARAKLQMALDFITKLDMAVVISQSQNEVDAFKKKGLDIAPHRLRFIKEDLDTKFKDPKDPLGLVFVCAMWMTGFDVPSCGAVYLDKPMRNHTLMQTIARANRVYEGKVNGLIVDYVGVFRNLQKALAIYGAGAGGGVGEGDTPVQPKEVQLEELKKLIADGKKFCADHGVDVDAIRSLTKLARITVLKTGVDKLIHPVETKKKYLTLATHADRVYRALGTDDRKLEHALDWGVLLDLARGIQGLEQPVDISAVMTQVEKLLDESVDANAYVIHEPPGDKYGGRVHLGEIDFEALARYFAKAKNKASTAEALTSATLKRVDALVRLNPTRRALRDKLEELIADYNEGAHTVAAFFEQLMAFIKKMEEEEGRAKGEGVSQEQLAFYDLLVGVEVTLDKKDQAAVKKIAADLPKKIEKKLVIDWRKSQMKRAAVRVAIKAALKDLPDAYDEVKYEAALEAVYEHVYESYWGEGKSKYVEGES